MTTSQGQLSDEGGHPGEGQCADCGGWQRIKAHGTVARHDGPGGRFCPGSDRRPVVPVPCSGCGRDGLALDGGGLCGRCNAAAWPRPAPGVTAGCCPAGKRDHSAPLGGDGMIARHQTYRGSGVACPGEGKAPDPAGRCADCGKLARLDGAVLHQHFRMNRRVRCPGSGKPPAAIDDNISYRPGGARPEPYPEPE